MSVWIGRNERELGADGPFSLSWDFFPDDDTSVSSLSSLMLEDGKDDIEDDGTLDGREVGKEDDEDDQVMEADREGGEEDVVVPSSFVEV